jgi:hypothetical protein
MFFEFYLLFSPLLSLSGLKMIMDNPICLKSNLIYNYNTLNWLGSIMKKIIGTVLGGLAFILLSGCTTVETVAVQPVVYSPGYSSDYIYSVGYYNNRPYWGNNYYYYSSGSGWGNNGYWGGGYYNGY